MVKLACDFETVVTGKKDQTKTEVWSAASIDLKAENTYDAVEVQGSIDDYMKFLFSHKEKVLAYFHNEKFDGSFIVDWLLKKGYEHVDHVKEKDMKNNQFSCLISSKGIWYSIKFKHSSRMYEIRDSYKLLPFSLSKIGKSFQTEHQKLEMEYEGARYANCKISSEEMKYIKNDVLVLKEALNIMEEQKHTKMTIGSCCMNEYKKAYHPTAFATLFPNLYGDNYRLPSGFGATSAGDYIRKSYKGGWCYLRPDRANMIFRAHIQFKGKKIAGVTCDVNSLYPSMMESTSGNRYPIGFPHFFTGEIPDYVKGNKECYYFVRVRTRFYLKEKHLPTIQIKNNPLYPPRKWLDTSDYVDRDGNHWKYLIDDISNLKTAKQKKIHEFIAPNTHDGIYEMIPELTLTMTDWQLLNEHYDLEDTEILDGCWFDTQIGIFDEYIRKYAEIKMKSKGAVRELAKLFLNNLYGKFATSPDASFKVPYLKDNVLHFYDEEDEVISKAGYIPIGTAITSYAREFTIRAAQANYDAFVYSDTDSIHLLCSPNDVKGAPEDPVKFNHWKYEACWDEAIFVRAKTYIEHDTHENREEVDPYYNVKCAGMPDRAKKHFIAQMENEPMKDDEKVEDYEKRIGIKKLNDAEVFFHRQHRFTLADFKIGLTVPGSLKPKRVEGGVVLFNMDYCMRPSILF